MRAIILAAGKGVRLNGTAGELPKCLVKVGDLTLVERQIQALRSTGIDEIVIVIGHGADRVRQTCGPDCTYVENTDYASTNSLFSLWLARDFLRDGFVVLNADVLFHPALLEDLLLSNCEDALLVAYSDGQAPPLGEEEMKVCVRGGRVADISKARNLLNYEPKVSLEEGLLALLDWVKDQRPDDRVAAATAELAARNLVK